MNGSSFQRGLIVGLTLVIATPAWATDLTPAEVRAAVETWVRHVTADGRIDAVVETMEPYRAAGEVVAYIAHLRDEGLCLCGADDRLIPVYHYAPLGMDRPTELRGRRPPEAKGLIAKDEQTLGTGVGAGCGATGLEPAPLLLWVVWRMRRRDRRRLRR